MSGMSLRFLDSGAKLSVLYSRQRRSFVRSETRRYAQCPTKNMPVNDSGPGQSIAYDCYTIIDRPDCLTP